MQDKIIYIQEEIVSYEMETTNSRHESLSARKTNG